MQTTSLAKRLPRVFAAVAGLTVLSYLMSGLLMEIAIGRPSSTAAIGFIFFPIASLIVAGIGYVVGLVARPFLSRRGERDRVDSSKLRRNSLLTIIVFAIPAGIAGGMQMVQVERHNEPRLISNSGAFPNSELEETADAVEVGMNARHLGKGLSIDGASQANAPETASEHLCARAAGLPCEGIESGKVILVDAERNHSRFLLPFDVRFDCGTPLRVTSDGRRWARFVDLTLTWRCEIK